MPNSTMTNNEVPDHAIWDSLQQAIARSSGFKRWFADHSDNLDLHELTVDKQVSTYLKETLETLAY